MPGAVEFIRFITSLKDTPIQPIFITSRENLTREGTARNLARLGRFNEAELRSEVAYDGLDEAGKIAHSLKTRLFMKGMPKFRDSDGEDHDLEIKFDQRVFCERVLGYEILLSIGDSLGDYAEYYGRMLDKDGKKAEGHPTIQGRRAAVWQDIRLFGREFILIPNATYGSWLRALEANRIGASDELAQSANPVRQPLNEPTLEFIYDDGKKADAVSSKLDAIPGNWKP